MSFVFKCLSPFLPCSETRLLGPLPALRSDCPPALELGLLFSLYFLDSGHLTDVCLLNLSSCVHSLHSVDGWLCHLLIRCILVSSLPFFYAFSGPQFKTINAQDDARELSPLFS